MKNFSVILAMDDKNGIGIKNELAWKINADMKYFKDITTKNEDLGKLNAVIIGRRTWESIPSKFKPLSDRINCIISKKLHTESLNSKIDDFVLHFNTFEHALEELDRKENVENIFVIGGTSVYNIGLAHPLVDKVYLTEVAGDFGSDRFVEFDRSKFKLVSQSDWQEENGIKFRFMVYEK